MDADLRTAERATDAQARARELVRAGRLEEAVQVLMHEWGAIGERIAECRTQMQHARLMGARQDAIAWGEAAVAAHERGQEVLDLLRAIEPHRDRCRHEHTRRGGSSDLCLDCGAVLRPLD